MTKRFLKILWRKHQFRHHECQVFYDSVASSLHYYGPATVFPVLLPQQSPTMPRKSHSSKQKVHMVRTMEERMANERSLTWLSIARDLGVDSSQIRKWQQQIAFHQIKLTRTPGTHHNPHARSLHPGRVFTSRSRFASG
jgi:transposase-like protein